MQKHKEEWLTAQQCADRTGLSVRALRLYEKYGLIAPHRTAKHWRLYGRAEIERLHEIVALKTLGMSLRGIGELLSGRISNVGRALQIQETILETQRRHAELGLQAIYALRERIALGERATSEDLLSLIRGMRSETPSEPVLGWMRYEQARPRTEIRMPAAQLVGLEGVWEFPDGIMARTRVQDGILLYILPGQTGYRLRPEALDRFFLKSLPIQVTFTRENGRIVSLTHHQDGHSDSATRASEERAEAFSAELALRIAAQAPLPESATHLIGIIDDHQNGRPDTSSMTPTLGRIVKEQGELVSTTLVGLGELLELSFRKVSEAGLDVYDATFACGRIEIGLALAPTGLIRSIYFT